MKVLFVPAVLLFLLTVLWSHINKGIIDWTTSINLLKSIGLPVLFLLISLSAVNWMLESLKWHLLVKRIQDESFLDSFKAVLFGISLGLITPNRIGEYGGRVINLRPENKAKGLTYSFVTSFFQLMTTIIAGIVGLFTLLYFFNFKLPLTFDLRIPVIFGIAMLLIAGIVILMRKNLIPVKIRQQMKEIGSTLKSISQHSFELSILSLLRYLVFSFQYCVLLLTFNVGLEPALCLTLVSVTYLINVVSPGGMFLNLSWRTTTSVFIFSLSGGDPMVVLLSSLMIWLINLFIPALLGLSAFKGIRTHSFSFK